MIVLNNLIIFQFIVSMYLKSISISSQLFVSSNMFHFNNCIIFLSKMILFPFVKKMDAKNLSILLFPMIFLSGFSYIATILSMIIANDLVVNILSLHNKEKNTPRQQFASKVGSIIGVLLVPSYLAISNIYSHLYTSTFMSFLVCLSIAFIIIPLISSDKKKIESEKKINPDSNLGIFQLAYKYNNVVLAYIFIAVLSYFTSNITFFSRSSKYAIAPALASLSLIFPFTSYYMCLPLILGLISLYYSSITVFIVTIIVGYVNVSAKLYAKEKYQDSYLPHLTASFCVDIIFLIFHFIVGCYCVFIK